MHGNERVRFCGECRLNVYNLSEMTREQAEELVQKNEGRLCVRFYRRPDGMVLTQPCSVAVRALKVGQRWFHAAVITLMAAVSWCHAYFYMKSAGDDRNNYFVRVPLLDELMGLQRPPPPPPIFRWSQGAIGRP
jgi:hypothetical protein